MAELRKTRVVVKRADVFKVMNWISINFQTLKNQKLELQVICDKILQETQIAVRPSDLRAFFRDAEMNISDISTAVVRTRKSKGNLSRKIASQLAATQDQLKIVCDQLGIPFNSNGFMDATWLRNMSAGKKEA